MIPRLLALLLTLLSVSSNSIAGEKEDRLIAKLTLAYGGEALKNLSSYTIVDHFLTPTTGQSHSPSLVASRSVTQQASFDGRY